MLGYVEDTTSYYPVYAFLNTSEDSKVTKPTRKRNVRYHSTADITNMRGFVHPSNTEFAHDLIRPGLYDVDLKKPNTPKPFKYLINSGEHQLHPDNHSRFGYHKISDAPYVYNAPSRGYVPMLNIDMGPDPQPKDMAPARFYEPEHQVPWKWFYDERGNKYPMYGTEWSKEPASSNLYSNRRLDSQSKYIKICKKK